MDIRASGHRRPIAIAVTAVALAATSFPATAAPPAEFVYDALGDSYAAGSGATVAYPQVLDGRMRISLDDLAAVGGATIPSMLGGQIDALDADTDLVTVSIGGNDINWGAAVTACMLGSEAQCAGAVALTSQRIQQQLPLALDAAYAQIGEAAPDAHVVVTGYPRLFSPEHGDYAGLLPGGQFPYLVSVAEQQMLNDGADLLNAVIADAAQDQGFQFVDVTSRFVGHGVNAPDAWITGIDHLVPFHPNDRGQHAYGVALRSQISPKSLR